MAIVYLVAMSILYLSHYFVLEGAPRQVSKHRVRNWATADGSLKSGCEKLIQQIDGQQKFVYKVCETPIGIRFRLQTSVNKYNGRALRKACKFYAEQIWIKVWRVAVQS